MENIKKPADLLEYSEKTTMLEDSIIEELINILQEELGNYENYLKKAEQKKEFIIKNNVDKLEEVTKEEGEISRIVGSLEARRELLFREVCKLLQLDFFQTTISNIMDYCAPKYHIKLEMLKNKLIPVTEEIKNLNELNSKLIKYSLDYINFSLNIFSIAGTDAGNYGKDGQVSDPARRNLLNCKL